MWSRQSKPNITHDKIWITDRPIYRPTAIIGRYLTFWISVPPVLSADILLQIHSFLKTRIYLFLSVQMLSIQASRFLRNPSAVSVFGKGRLGGLPVNRCHVAATDIELKQKEFENQSNPTRSKLDHFVWKQPKSFQNL